MFSVCLPLVNVVNGMTFCPDWESFALVDIIQSLGQSLGNICLEWIPRNLIKDVDWIAHAAAKVMCSSD